MNHFEQIAWQKEVIQEELFDSLKERSRNGDTMDEDLIEELLTQKRKFQ